MSTSSIADRFPSLRRKFESLIREVGVSSTEDEILNFYKKTLLFVALKGELRSRQNKNELVIENLRFVFSTEKNPDGSEDSKLGVQTWCTLRLVEELPPGSPQGRTEQLFIGNPKPSRDQALAEFRDEVEECVKEAEEVLEQRWG
ncbi:hypothetical protein J1614_003137 [Plenodomus biglobosus]|nr:hypothetical protein J1614_003137 [Plenodomus biglobosus]